MSARVCYLERSARGLSLHSLRLVGQASDDSWPHTSPASGALAADFDQAAAWLRASLESARSRDDLELLCLDAEGSGVGWITTPSDDPQVVAALARQGAAPDTSDAPSPTNFIDYFAPSVLDSSVQPIAGPAENGSPPAKRPRRARKQEAAPPRRVGVLAVGDLPARMLIDALDHQGVRVGAVATLWHALAQAWDPATATPPPADRAVASSAQLVAVVLVEPKGRLHWCWSRSGRVRAAGSMRLRSAAPARVGVSPEDAEPAPVPVISRNDASRLTGEWLSWAMQFSEAPSRIVLVLPSGLAEDASPDALSAAALGEELTTRWPGVAVDAAVHDDPLGATFRRLVAILERTPPAAPEPGVALVSLSNRPGRTHRSMHVWVAGALALLGLALGVLGWKFRADSVQARAAAAGWAESWRGPVEQVYPDALRPRIKMSSLDELEAELKKRRDAITLPAQAERAKPVLQELETLSLVLAAPTIDLEDVKLDGATGVTVRVITATTGDAEALLEGFRRIGGSHLEGWSMEILPMPGQTDKRKARYEARWVKEGA